MAVVTAAPADWPLPGGRPPETADDCRVLAGWASRAVALGQLDSRLAREVLAACSLVLKAISAGALAAKLQELETTIAKLKSSRGAVHHERP